MAGPSNEEQLYIELINETRLDPYGSAARYITAYATLTSNDPAIQSALDYFNVNGTALQQAFAALLPVGPVAWNEALSNAAAAHSAAMIAADAQSHQVPGEPALGGRADAAGYTGWSKLGENVYSYARSEIYGHAGFMVDWGPGLDGMQTPPGHRNNIMNGAFREIGIDVTAETNPATSVGPQVVTQDFGVRSGAFFVLGVAYADGDGNRFYSIGEGRGDLVMQARGASVTSAASGGYSLGLTAGQVDVTLNGGGLASGITVSTTIGTENLKLDVVNGNTLLTSGSISVAGSSVSTVRGLGVRGVSLTTGAGNQTLEGTSGDDTLTGGAGADVLIGNGGSDTAVFSGNRSDYRVTGDAGGGYRLVDQRTGGGDGSDVARGIELFRFADRTVAAADIMPNVFPVANSDISATGSGKPVIIAVLANDSDENVDVLSLSTVTTPGHGTAVINAGGTVTYTPTAGYVGADSFLYTISDGKGGSATGTVSVNVTADPRFRLISFDGFVGDIKGTGDVLGTNSFQDITILAGSGRVMLDGSFGRGGDIVRLEGNASTYTIALSGSSAVLKQGGGEVVIPLGLAGTPLVFADGVRKLVYDAASNSAKIGSQVFGATAAAIAAGSDGTALPGGANASATARLLLAEGSETTVSGKYEILGSNGVDRLHLLDGNFALDGSFGRGGDVLSFDGSAGGYTAQVAGSQVVLADADTRISIPVGLAGVVLDFADADRTLRYDANTATIMIGSQAITTNAAFLFG